MLCSSSCASAVRTLGTPTRRGRTRCTASGRRRPDPVDSRRRCARCRSCCGSPTWCALTPRPARGSSTSPTPSASSHGRCCRRVTARSGCATSRSASSADSQRSRGVTPDDVALGHVGLNHLTWERSVKIGGRDILPALLRDRLGDLADEVELAPSLLAQLGVVPSYYLRYYYAHDACWRSSCASRRAPRLCVRSRTSCSTLYADPAVDTKPEALERRGGAFYSEAAVELLAEIRGGAGPAKVVNLRNDGVLPFLPDDHVIEVPARFVDGAFRRRARRCAG